MGKTYRTAQGRMVDMETIKLKNELTPALGNMRVNARGDQLGPGGQIIKTREELMNEYYKVAPAPENILNSPPVLPKRKKEEPVSTSAKRAREFMPVDIAPDTELPKSSKVAEVEKLESSEIKGGLAAAVMKARERRKERRDGTNAE